jgi:hypothetical protein
MLLVFGAVRGLALQIITMRLTVKGEVALRRYISYICD